MHTPFSMDYRTPKPVDKTTVARTLAAYWTSNVPAISVLEYVMDDRIESLHVPEPLKEGTKDHCQLALELISLSPQLCLAWLASSRRRSAKHKNLWKLVHPFVSWEYSILKIERPDIQLFSTLLCQLLIPLHVEDWIEGLVSVPWQVPIASEFYMHVRWCCNVAGIPALRASTNADLCFFNNSGVTVTKIDRVLILFLLFFSKPMYCTFPVPESAPEIFKRAQKARWLQQVTQGAPISSSTTQ